VTLLRFGRRVLLVLLHGHSEARQYDLIGLGRRAASLPPISCRLLRGLHGVVRGVLLESPRQGFLMVGGSVFSGWPAPGVSVRFRRRSSGVTAGFEGPARNLGNWARFKVSRGNKRRRGAERNSGSAIETLGSGYSRRMAARLFVRWWSSPRSRKVRYLVMASAVHHRARGPIHRVSDGSTTGVGEQILGAERGQTAALVSRGAGGGSAESALVPGRRWALQCPVRADSGHLETDVHLLQMFNLGVGGKIRSRQFAPAEKRL
jgi:hypothetical protein